MSNYSKVYFVVDTNYNERISQFYIRPRDAVAFKKDDRKRWLNPAIVPVVGDVTNIRRFKYKDTP